MDDTGGTSDKTENLCKRKKVLKMCELRRDNDKVFKMWSHASFGSYFFDI